MKKYKYYGDLKKDLKVINKKFNSKDFFKRMIFHGISLIIFASLFCFTGIVSNLFGFSFGYLGSASVLSFIRVKSKSKYDSEKAIKKVSDLYGNINFSNRALAKERMKECIVIQRKQRVVENTESVNIVLSDEEKIVNYFYLLNPEDKIQVLRQIKDELIQNNSEIYLLEEQELEIEDIEISEDIILKLKNKTVK